MFIDFLMPDDQEFGASLTDGSEVVSQHEIHVVSIKPVFPIRIVRVASLQLLVRGSKSDSIWQRYGSKV